MPQELKDTITKSLFRLNPFATVTVGSDTQLVKLSQSNLAPQDGEKIAKGKPIDRINETTTPSEYEEIVFEYLRDRFGIQDKNSPAFEKIRDAIVYASVFAPPPATFDELAIGNILLPMIQSVKHVNLTTAILEDFGAIQYTGQIEPSEDEARAWIGIRFRERIAETKLPAPETLDQMLIESYMALTQRRYEIQPEVKQKLNAVLEKYG